MRSARFAGDGGPSLLTWPAFDGSAVDAAVTTRWGGVSTGRFAELNLGLHVGDADRAVLENRRRVADSFGAAPRDFVFCEQVHGAAVTVVTTAHRGRGAVERRDGVPATDALVTATPGVVLSVLVADCVPLVLHDPVRQVLGCVHAGWRGTVAGVARAAVETMSTLGSDPRDVIAAIGPSISPQRYEVGIEAAGPAGEAFGADAGRVLRATGARGRWTFDLWQANVIQLRRAGLRGGSIHLAGMGTGPGTDFFSHRFEGPCGRFAVLARLHARRADRDSRTS